MRPASLCLSLLLLWLLAPLAYGQDCLPTTTDKPQITLAWEATADPRVTGYLLEQQIDAEAWSEVATLPLTPLTTTVRGLAAPHTYTYRLSALGLEGGTVLHSGFAARGTPLPCVTVTAVEAPPGGPTKLLGRPQVGTMLLLWDTTDPRLLVEVLRRTPPATTFVKIAVVTGSFFLDTSLALDTRVCYHLKYEGSSERSGQWCGQTRGD